MKDLNVALHESSEEFGEVIELIASSFEKSCNSLLYLTGQLTYLHGVKCLIPGI